MPNPKPPYPPEFRAEAVRLARQPGHSIRRVVMDLGISNESLRRWVIQAEIDRGDNPGLTTDERAELALGSPPRKPDPPDRAGDPEERRGEFNRSLQQLVRV